jgi:hypothetical protein
LRRWSSADPVKPTDPSQVDFPAYWLEQPGPPSAAPGMHRFVWDFRAGDGGGPFAPPGRYRVRLTLAGRTFEQTLTLRRDPRVPASDADLVAQYDLAREIGALRERASAAVGAALKHRAALSPALQARLDAVLGPSPSFDPNGSFGPATQIANLRHRIRLLRELEGQVESADARPTPYEVANWHSLQQKTLQSLAELAAIVPVATRETHSP